MDQYNNYIGLLLDGRYKIKRLLGIGGMAMVFEADDTFRKIPVAVKILKDEFASDEVSVQRFINESKAVLMLSHINIVKIFDVSVKGENKYIVMEYIDGITLKNYIERKGALSVKETISYSIQILRALEHAHLGGVIHRDIKPQNIMLLKNGQIKVTDFGIAKLPDAKTLTATDKAIGTVYYISPEQAAGEKGIDRRTDLYSVGVMMYEMLTGKLPFDAENPVSIAL
ncbi:MAG: serine/threonine protein kinase, partial [Clostridia bacterium]|nr:serine/threonine protein kinase [Clostridia bacterium]